MESSSSRSRLRGHYLRPFAKILLALTALREKQTEIARTQLTELVTGFPQNPLFTCELAKLSASPATASNAGSGCPAWN
jgi:hypothetical protein